MSSHLSSRDGGISFLSHGVFMRKNPSSFDIETMQLFAYLLKTGRRKTAQPDTIIIGRLGKKSVPMPGDIKAISLPNILMI